jgi:hypothetical protein
MMNARGWALRYVNADTKDFKLGGVSVSSAVEKMAKDCKALVDTRPSTFRSGPYHDWFFRMISF